MVIFNIHVEHVHGAVQRTAAIQQVLDDGVPALLLAGEDDVDDAGLGAHGAAVVLLLVGHARHADLPVLPALGAPLDVPVAVEHGQQAVGAVQPRVLGCELRVHAVVAGDVE